VSEEHRGKRRRRTRAEAEELVREYERSGLSRKEFSLQRGLAVGTLDRYRKLRRQTLDGGDGSNRWVGVELSGPKPIGGSELAVVLPSGRRIEVKRGFDAGTLEQLVLLLERA
jgi:hypothetical protein